MFSEDVKYSGVVDYEHHNVCDMHYFLHSVFKNIRSKVLECKTKKPKTSSTCTTSETQEESQSSEPLHNSCAIPFT